MMKIRWLTPAERDELDPTGKARNMIRALTTDVRERLPYHVRSKDIDPTAFIRAYGQKLIDGTPPPYASLVQDNLAKVARQGGHFPVNELKRLCLRYYTMADERARVTPHPALLRARDYLIDLISRQMKDHGIHYWDFKPAAKSTFSGLPVCGKRGTKDAEEIGVHSGWTHAHYTIPGERHMRGKPRSIFMLANPDFRYVERDLTVTRNWLKAQFPNLFSAWLRPDLAMEPIISRSLARGYLSIEEDYVEMDTTVSWSLIQQLVLPIYEVMLGDRFYRFAAYVEESFSAGLYWGDEVWDGAHTLFSGLPYTNDFETLISIIISIASVKTFSVEEWAVVALGDDLSLLLKGSRKKAQAIHALQLEMAASIGMQLHDDEKFRIATREVRFCRKAYWPANYGGAKGAYPSILALNNILQPEVLQPSLPTALGADLQRIDGCQFSPDYPSLVKVYAALLTDDSRAFIREHHTDIQSPAGDWWDTLYGTTWSPTESPTYWRLLAELGLSIDLR